ncbi:hypothetical protein FH609_027195 [Streptomyces sp. 3MP-14]|uniref:Excreted virulence factor EspC, type VII ESX diderm n=1 Tax=Streptomyces mimosae TaxID=2586635 RepID=A0A5N5ZYN5_9ACTN|nr:MULTISPECIES: hypothetical protein [Streptomyces]KAB8161385.1 hypothetical protein FH607_025200 [Streptomyces mimosae]KAB8173291.1 hypothetical protein FH609_027195 [Streptomyces sp. 3MP-14]
MSFLRFFEDEVRELAARLESSGDDMREASRSLSGTSAASIGPSELASRCDDFADSWDYGFGQLSELTSGIGEVAINAAETYTATDEELERALSEGGSGG